MESVADAAVIPMQDILGLGEEARMNRPGGAARELGVAPPESPDRPAGSPTRSPR